MYWEIVEVAEGEVVLRQVDEEGEPMVSIRFSKQAMSRLSDRHVDVAKAMFSAGMQLAYEFEPDMSESADSEFELEGEADSEYSYSSDYTSVIH